MSSERMKLNMLFVAILLTLWQFYNGAEVKQIEEKSPKSATCVCELQMVAGWQNLQLLSIFKRKILAWGPGSSPCARMREGCRILCQIIGRRYIKGRKLTSICQGTKLGQRLCELYSRKNGYEEIKAPGRHVSLNYKLDKCWSGKQYLKAVTVHGKLCCSSFAPFKNMPFVKFMVWNETCASSGRDMQDMKAPFY